MAEFDIGKPVLATTGRQIETTDEFTLSGSYDAGSELIENGGFVGNADGWTLNDASSYSAGKVTVLYASSNDPEISTHAILVTGSVYLITFEITGATDDVYIYFDNNAALSPAFHGDGLRTFLFTSTFTGSELVHFSSSNFGVGTGWTIDNVSCKEVTAIRQGLEIKDAFDRLILALGGENRGNYALGLEALLNNVGEHNIAIGDGAGKSITTAQSCIIIGDSVDALSPTQDGQVAIGARLRMNVSGVKFDGTEPTTYILSNPTSLAELRALMIGLGLAQ